MNDIAGGFDFQVVSPNRVVLKERVSSLIVPGIGGAVGFWPGHAQMLVALQPGLVKYRPVDGAEAGPGGGQGPDHGFRLLAVGGGFFEMSPDGQATLLADTAELPEEIDVERARAALERARSRLFRPGRDVDTTRAEAALHRALARLQAVARGAAKVQR